MAERTLLSSVSFSARERYLVDHPAARCLILSTTNVNISLFFLPKCSGIPRCFFIQLEDFLESTEALRVCSTEEQSIICK
ncbi:unnamed protein product [Brassica oleracea var. botrytis]